MPMRIRRMWRPAACGACVMMLGCSAPDFARGPVPVDTQRAAPATVEGSDTTSLLEYYLSLEALGEEELQQEFARAQQVASERHQPADRVRLAMLLGLTRAPFRNYDRSLALLDEAINDPAGRDPAAKTFLAFLSSQVREFKRQGEQYQKLDVKLKEEKKQKELLQQKLDELTTIEQKLLEQGSKKGP
jgi:hypothetical protein